MSLLFYNKTFLVVDDDAENRALIIEAFDSPDNQTVILSATNGQQALKILEKKTVDLIILDWEMPVLDGISTLRILKQNPEWHDIPVLIYTGVMTATEHLVEAMRLGAVDFLRKPTHALEIIARVQSVLQQQHNFRETLRLERENNLLLQQELSSYLIMLSHKNAVLSDIYQKAEMPQKPATLLLKEIASQAQQDLEKEDYWASFLEKFNKTAPNFMPVLSSKYPDLSNNELKLCALLRCGIDNKEIALLLNISLSGVEKSRYRIRKKMNLENNESLDKILLGLNV